MKFDLISWIIGVASGLGLLLFLYCVILCVCGKRMTKIRISALYSNESYNEPSRSKEKKEGNSEETTHLQNGTESQGLPGPKGDRGDTGTPEPAGLRGPRGSQGLRGPKGEVVQPGRYLILNSPEASFKENVRDKFQKVIPEDLSEGVNLEKTLKKLNIANLAPRIKNNGKYDKRFTKGLENLVQYEIKPASANEESSAAMLQKETTGSQGAPTKYNLKKNYIKTLNDQYHLDQEILFFHSHHDLLKFIKLIDELSENVMEEYRSSALETSMSADGEGLRKKIHLCKKILVQRLTVHKSAENDLMTNRGYRDWRDHAWVVSSVAVHYISLQLLRKKTFGTFFE